MTRSIFVAAISLALFMATAVPAGADDSEWSIKVGPALISAQEDIGTCNNVWALDTYEKFYTLTLNLDGTYDLNIDYKRGTFVTLAGTSPGACEDTYPNGDGSTVEGGITGKLHATWDRTVTATSAPNSDPDCGSCETASGFLDAVFGAGNWSGGDWTYSGYYQAGSHGFWYDTMSNWPYDDRGDIN